MRALRRARVLHVDLPRRDVAHRVLDDADPHHRRRHADRADAEDVVDDDLPDLLGGLVALFLALAAGRSVEIERLEHRFFARRHAFFAVGHEPVGDQRAHHRLGRVDRQGMAREGVDQLRSVVRPHEDLVLVVAHAGHAQVALQLRDVELDADLLPLLGDGLGDAGEGHERAGDGKDLQAQPPAAVAAHAKAFAVLLGQTDLVEELVGLLDVERGPLGAPLFAGALRHVRGRRDAAGGADPEPEGLVELVAVDPHRERAPEVGVLQPLRHLRVGVVAVVDLEGGVGAVGAGVEVDAVVALLHVLQKDRQLGDVGVALLQVVLAGDGAQVQHLQVLGQRHLDAVEVGELVPLGIDLVIEGLRSMVQFGVLTGETVRQGPSTRQVRVEGPLVLELEEGDPVLDILLAGHRVDVGLRRVLRMELLEVVRRRVGPTVEATVGHVTGAHERRAAQNRQEERVGIFEDELDRRLVDLFDPPLLAVDGEGGVRGRGPDPGSGRCPRTRRRSRRR